MDEYSAVDVSIVLPVYNERDHLVEEVDRVRAAMDASRYSYEIIVVDDGSSDGSEELVRTLDDVRVIQFAHNRGSGSARRWGTRAARGDIVVWTDVDMSYPNDRIPWLVDQMESHDQVVGARSSEEGTLKFFRVPAKWGIRKLAERLSGTKIPDLNSGLRAFRRPVALQYLNQLPPGFSCVTTITMAFLAAGYSIRYVPIDYAPRAGTSKFHWLRDTARYGNTVIRMILTYNPLRIFMPVGTFLLSVAVGKLIYDWVDKDFRLAANTVVVFLVSLFVIMIGLLADLVGRMNRPVDQVQPAELGRLTPGG